MAYTAPTTRATSDKITASIWNTDLVDNIINHETRISAIEAGVLTEYYNPVRQSVANTVSETNLVSYALAADWFSDGSNYNNLMLFEFEVTLDNDSGSTYTMTIRVKLGSTTLFTPITGITCTTANEQRLHVSGRIWATTQNAQRFATESRAVTSVSAVTNYVGYHSMHDGTATEDASGALNFVISTQMSAASPNLITYLDRLWIGGPVELKTS